MSDNTLRIWFVAGGNLTLMFLRMLTRFRVAVAFTSGASRREAMLTAWPTLLSICERSRCCSESASRLRVSDLPTALREVYLLSPTVLWLLCGCGSPCPNGP